MEEPTERKQRHERPKRGDTGKSARKQTGKATGGYRKRDILPPRCLLYNENQKKIRLQKARQLLFAENLDAAEAGFIVGYESPSQFSREYARMFGLPPISDIRSLRNTITASIGI
ncbi:AraC-like DNA-binding protein [Halalkalibacter oceani]